MSDKVFTNGLVFKLAENAPDYVKGKLSVKVEEFITFLRQHEDNGWVNIDLKVSQGGKAYAELNTWKPQQNGNNNFRPSSPSHSPASLKTGEPQHKDFQDDIPF